MRAQFGTRGSQVQILSPRPIQWPDSLREFRGGPAFVFRGFGPRGHSGDKRRQPRDSSAQIAEVDPRVDVRGEARIGVAEHALCDDQRDAGAREQRCRGAAQVVEAQRARERLGPQLHLAARAETQLVVLGLLLVSAALAPADVEVAAHQPCAAHRATQNLLQVCLVGPHRAIGSREHEVAARLRDGFLEEKLELLRDGQHVRVLALRGVVVVGAAHGDRCFLEVHVALAQTEQLTLSQTGVDSAGKERPPLRRERGEQLRHLVRFQRVEHFARHFAPLHGLRRVLALPCAHAVRRKPQHRADADARQLSSLGRLVHPTLRRAQVPRHGIDIPEGVGVRNCRKLSGCHRHSITVSCRL